MLANQALRWKPKARISTGVQSYLPTPGVIGDGGGGVGPAEVHAA